MALDQSALSELLDALRAGDDLDIVREALVLVLQSLIEAEATQVIGAGHYERSAARTTHRNGARSRLLSTKAGDCPGVRAGRLGQSGGCWSELVPMVGIELRAAVVARSWNC